MTEHFNQLTPAQAERLAMLAEECGEVIQSVGKILRHGYESGHPENPKVTNRRLLEKEISDILGVHLAMIVAGDICSPGDIEAAARNVWAKKLRYTRHQEGPAAPRSGQPARS